MKRLTIATLIVIVSISSQGKDQRLRPTTEVILHDICNKTLTPSSIELSDLNTVKINATTTKHDYNDDDDDDDDDDDASPIYCWTRFEGLGNQYIEIVVKELRLGPESCLRISDERPANASDWLPPQPTTLCGGEGGGGGTLDDVAPETPSGGGGGRGGGRTRVRRRTWSPFALVEFKHGKVKQEGAFEYDATFMSKEEDVERLPYGHIDRKEGRISNTVCDWLIRVDECEGFCSVVSPGHPGIYPPNTICRYHFENSDNSRVELKFGGKHFSGIFDLRESKNCQEDFVEVHDGRSVTRPLIGRFCGRTGAHLISSGSAMLMIFQSGRGEVPPWNYTGFNMQTRDRWNYYIDAAEGGGKKPNSSCDLVVQSSYSFSGDLHTPDYFLSTETNCTYEFHSSEKYRERIELTVLIQQMAHGDQANCTETLAVYDGAREIKRFCIDRDGVVGRNEFVLNTTSPSAFVRYYTSVGQISNPDPSWMYFKFFRLPRSNAVQAAPGRKEVSTLSSTGNEPSLSRANDPNGLIVILPSGDVPANDDSNAAGSTRFEQTMSVHRTVTLAAIPHLLLVTYFRRK